MENIIWKSIVGSLHYSVSNTGLVRRDSHEKMHNINKKPFLTKEKILAPSTNNTKGYKRLLIKYPQGIKTKSVHRLVAEAFVPNLMAKPQVNHIDGDILNNHCSNLEWVTNDENAEHAARTKKRKHKKGSSVVWSKLTENEVTQIPELLQKFSVAEIAKQFNVSKSLIHEIIAGRTWRHLNLFEPKARKCEKYFDKLRYVPTTAEKQETS